MATSVTTSAAVVLLLVSMLLSVAAEDGLEGQASDTTTYAPGGAAWKPPQGTNTAPPAPTPGAAPRPDATTSTDDPASSTHGYSSGYHNWYTGSNKYYYTNNKQPCGGGCNDNCNCKCPTTCPCTEQCKCPTDCKCTEQCKCPNCQCPDCVCKDGTATTWDEVSTTWEFDKNGRFGQSLPCAAGQAVVSCLCNIEAPSADVVVVGTWVTPRPHATPTRCNCAFRNLKDVATTAVMNTQVACR